MHGAGYLSRAHDVLILWLCMEHDHPMGSRNNPETVNSCGHALVALLTERHGTHQTRKSCKMVSSIVDYGLSIFTQVQIDSNHKRRLIRSPVYRNQQVKSRVGDLNVLAF
jgi:predicted component of type VI protein secretion system